jgi:general nucleoside transport system permease protein
MQNFLISGLLLSTPLLLAALGDLYAEKSGVLNLGIEASMIMGAFFAYHFAYLTGSAYVGLFAAIIVGLLMGLLNALFLVTLRCSQVVYGVAINILGLGFTSTLFRLFFDVSKGYQRSPGLPNIVIPGISSIPFIGPIVSNQNIFSYIAVGFLVVTGIVFKHTTVGLKIRAVGENPHAADSLGVSVVKTRYAGLLVSGVFSAMGGAALTIGVLQYFQDGMTAGRGYVALAAIIFGRYTPAGLLFGALLFGMANAFQLRMQVVGLDIPYHIFLTLPYVVTILALFIMGASTAPRHSGTPFVRGGEGGE